MDRTAKLPILNFEGTVKVHGTNSGMQLSQDILGLINFNCQSREREITVNDDNAGFAISFFHSQSNAIN